MLFEFIATIAAAFGMAGLALIITHLCKLAGKRAPKVADSLVCCDWDVWVPGTPGIQLVRSASASDLPDGVEVVKTAESTGMVPPVVLCLNRKSCALSRLIRAMLACMQTTQICI